MTSKVERAHAFIEGITVAEMTMEFQREFKGVYPDHILRATMMNAVGPMQSFVGFCIQRGYLEVRKPHVTEPPLDQKVKTTAPCPFCDGGANYLAVLTRFRPMPEHAVICNNCQALGPDADTIQGAWDLWDKRVGVDA